ncbi:hypothetical protein RI129_002855 [Pyrocoelia pectoralis]|uniref:Uncharacterized protein n=1 Tax=Pyrocoelia pectoralis TaxID=417401 RepID=A0AAN7ZU85_9COLE
MKRYSSLVTLVYSIIITLYLKLQEMYIAKPPPLVVRSARTKLKLVTASKLSSILESNQVSEMAKMLKLLDTNKEDISLKDDDKDLILMCPTLKSDTEMYELLSISI